MEALMYISAFRAEYPFQDKIDRKCTDEHGRNYYYYKMMYGFTKDNAICRDCFKDTGIKRSDTVKCCPDDDSFYCPFCDQEKDGDRYHWIRNFNDVLRQMKICAATEEEDGSIYELVEYFDNHEEHRQMMIRHIQMMISRGELHPVTILIFNYICRNVSICEIVPYFRANYVTIDYANIKDYLKHGECKKIEGITALICHCFNGYHFGFYLELMKGLVPDDIVINIVKSRSAFLDVINRNGLIGNELEDLIESFEKDPIDYIYTI